jgi:hypothetical protein
VPEAGLEEAPHGGIELATRGVEDIVYDRRGLAAACAGLVRWLGLQDICACGLGVHDLVGDTVGLVLQRIIDLTHCDLSLHEARRAERGL